MALSLLQRVATKALDTLGGAASSAINYLSKNAPHVIDRTLEANPLTRVFSTRGQQEVADVGRTLQRAPDTTYHPPAPFIKTPQSMIQDKVTEFTTSIPGQYAQSMGRTLERVATPTGRQALIHGATQLPGQVKNLDFGGVINNPVLEDTLNATDLFTLGAGTVLKQGTKMAAKQGVKQAIKFGAKDVIKEGIEQEAKTAAKTIFKEATDKPGLVTKTAEVLKKTADVPSVDEWLHDVKKIAPDKYVSSNGIVFKTKKGFSDSIDEVIKGVQPQVNPDQDLALKYLEKTRNGVSKAVDAAGDVVQAGKQKTADLFQKGTDIAKKWINTREGYTQWRAGDIKRNPALTQFDKEGMGAILDLQSGKNAGRYQAVKEFTDGLFELEKKAGILEPGQYRKNYLPQMWDNTPEEIEQVFKKTVGGTPGFSKHRIFKDIQEGIDAGLKPRFNTMSDVLESRFKTAQKSLADKELVDDLIKTGNAKTLDKAPQGWQMVDLKNSKGQALAVDADTAKIIQRYTSEGSPLLEKTAQFVSNVKQTILSAGVPKTGWNFHTGVNIPARAMAIRKNPFGAAVDSVIWNTNPKSAVKYIENVVPKDITDGLLKAGLTISRSAEDTGYGFKPQAGKGLYKKITTGFDKLFSEAAFDKVLPAHKLKAGWETYQQALKSGSSEAEAFKIAAETANTAFGGVNPAEMTKSKDFHNVMRTLLLAPDWLQSNVKIAGKLGGLLHPGNWKKAEYAPFKRFAVNAASMYGTFAMTNKALSGHWPWENGTGQEFNLATGSYDDRGRERMVSAFGTAFDFIRLPLTVVSSVAGNDPKQALNIVKNRLSPPVSSAISLASNEDYRGRDIVNPEKSPLDNIAGIAGVVGNAVGVPSQVTNTITALRGESTPEELVANLLEAPIRYRGGAKTPSQRETASLLKEGGATNKDIGAAMGGGKPTGGGFAGLFGKKDYSTLGVDSKGEITMPKTKKEREALNKSVDAALEAGADLPDSAIITRFFDGKTYDKSARKGQQDILDKMLKVADDEYLDPAQKAKIASAAKIDQADLQYYRTASLDQDERLEGLLKYASSADPAKRDELIEDLVLGKKEVGGKSMFSTSMYDRLYDEGIITKQEKALISAIKYDPIFNKFYMDRDYKGSGGGGASASKVKAKISAVNGLFKKTIKGTSDIDKQIRELSKPVEAPKINFSRSQRPSGQSSSRWFTPY